MRNYTRIEYYNVLVVLNPLFQYTYNVLGAFFAVCHITSANNVTMPQYRYTITIKIMNEDRTKPRIALKRKHNIKQRLQVIKSRNKFDNKCSGS